jgi:hypothetical protein
MLGLFRQKCFSPQIYGVTDIPTLGSHLNNHLACVCLYVYVCMCKFDGGLCDMRRPYIYKCT